MLSNLFSRPRPTVLLDVIRCGMMLIIHISEAESIGKASED